VSQFLFFIGVKDNKMGGTSSDILSTILDKMHLGHLIENFQREKVAALLQHPTSCNRVAKRVKGVVCNDVGICCAEMLSPFGRTLARL